MDQLTAWLDRHHISLTALLLSLVLLLGATVIATLVKRLLQAWLGRLGALVPIPARTALVVTRLALGILWAMALILILGLWGVSVGGLWTLLVSAVAVIGVGFVATWAMVSNITASFFIAVWRPFQLGDTVEVLPEALKGRVVGRNLMFVMLREESGAVLHIPNNLFFQKPTRVTPAQTAGGAG